jgi:hypothetical protein
LVKSPSEGALTATGAKELDPLTVAHDPNISMSLTSSPTVFIVIVTGPEKLAPPQNDDVLLLSADTTRGLAVLLD